MSLKNALYYENYENYDVFESKVRDHSLYNTWKLVADTLKKDHQHSNILQVECGAGFLVHLLMKDYQFTNVHGIDLRSDLIDRFKKLNPNIQSNVSNFNYFRLSDKDLNRYDVFVFSKILEYCENDLAYIERIPKGKTIVILYPSNDDGLCLHHFAYLSHLESYLSKLVTITDATQVEIFKNSEYMVDNKLNLIFGIKK